MKTIAIYKEYWTQPRNRLIRQPPPFHCDHSLVGFFDGAASNGKGGCGFVLYINEDHFYHGWLGIFSRTNNLAELTALWSLLYWSLHLNIKELRIFGDSLLVINWLLGKSQIKAHNLSHRCNRIMEQIKRFDMIKFEHIYREHNLVADFVSKKGMDCSEGILQVDEYLGDNNIRRLTHRLF